MDLLLEDLLIAQNILAPEMIEVFIRRYEILQSIYGHQPIGRRNLAIMLGIGEKIIRNEVVQLQEKFLIEIKNQGMYVTQEGIDILAISERWIHKLKAVTDVENEIKTLLNIKKVIISKIDSKNDQQIMEEVSRNTGMYLKSIIKEGMIIGVTGGSTMASVAKESPKYNCSKKNITVVPARGGLGVDLETQANNVAATLAEKLSCQYKLLHITENLSKEILKSLMVYPEIKETIDLIDKIDLLLFGIGRADEMAKRRNLGEERIKLLTEGGAVAEAFGYYFDKRGTIVNDANTAGITLKQYKRLKHIIGTATGRAKAEAILAISGLNNNLVLVIDEGLADELLNSYKKR